jgi:LacI family transcriptional regulator
MITVPGNGVPLRVVAERAKVSRMTVSLALRDDPSISLVTRRRVQKLARQLGYRPDPDIAGLMEKIRHRNARREHWKVIAYLTAYESRFAWTKEPTGLMYFEGAKRRAHDCGFKLEEFWVREPKMTGKRLGDIIRTRGIDGILIAPVPDADQPFQDFEWSNFSSVALGYSLHHPALHRACNHHFHSMFLLVEEIYKLGCGRVGLAFSEHADDRVRHLWRGGFLTAQSLLAPRCEISPLFMREWNKDEFARWVRRFKPDAVVTIGARVALWLKELGLSVPRELGLANVDLRPDMIGVTGIEQNSRQIGAAAVDLLLWLMHRNERGVPTLPRITMVEGTFVRGETVRSAVATL